MAFFILPSPTWLPPCPPYSLSLSSFSYSLFILSLSSSHAVLSLHLLHECTSIKRVLQKINRGGPARRHAASGESAAGGGWNSFTKKFRCKFKPQVCDSCDRAVVKSQRSSVAAAPMPRQMPIVGAKVLDDELHSALQESQLRARHALAHVQHRHEVQ